MATRATCVACNNEFDYESVKCCPKDGTPLTPIAGAKPNLVGETLDARYKILQLIGEGKSGHVYKAEQLQFNRVVAVKVLHTHLVNSDEALKRFQREAQATSKLRHPNLLTLLDFGCTEKNQVYMVTEYLDGATLESLVESGQLTVEQILSIFDQVCDGLMLAHEQQIIHRDIKPGNIVIVAGKEGQAVPKVIDFGLVKFLNNIDQTQQLTQEGQIAGTPAYMSPEQCSGKELDARTDVYSLACVLYFALTGRAPFVGSHMGEIIVKQMKETAPSFSTSAPHLRIPGEVEHVVFKALAKDRDHRHHSIKEFQEALLRAHSGSSAPEPAHAAAVVQTADISAEMLLAQPQMEESRAPRKQQHVMFDAEKASRSLVAKDHHQRVDGKSAEVFDQMRRRQTDELSERILRSMKSSFVGDQTRAWLQNVDENLSVDAAQVDRQLCQLSLSVLIDKLFDDFQRYACLFNQTEENRSFVVSCVRPKLTPDQQAGSTYEGHLQNSTWAMKVVGDSKSIKFLFVPAQQIYKLDAGAQPIFLELTVRTFDQGAGWSIQKEPLFLSQLSLLSKKIFARLMRVSRGEVSEKETLTMDMAQEAERVDSSQGDPESAQDPTDVITYALISILEAIDQQLINLRKDGSAALKRGGIDAVTPVMLKTKRYDSLRDKTSTLAKEWANMLVN